LKILLAAALLAAAPVFAQQRLVDPSATDSARCTALAMLRHLAEGDIAEAAALSNAPRRRFEVLRDYRDAIGEHEFRRVFGRYFAPESRLIAEVAIGRHRLLIWDLGEAGNRLTGQYYVEVEGKFRMDDVPSRERTELRRVLEAYRSGKERD
jgi:hypothetical protein